MNDRQELATEMASNFAGVTGQLYRTGLALKGHELRCHHCPSYVRSTPVAGLAIVRPRWRYANDGSRTRRSNTVDFQPVCDDHNTDEYIESSNNPAPKPARIGRLRRTA